MPTVYVEPHPDAAGEDDQAGIVQPLGRDVTAVGPVHAHHCLPRCLQLLDQALRGTQSIAPCRNKSYSLHSSVRPFP